MISKEKPQGLPIKGLTADRVDWLLFHDSYFARQNLERWFPQQSDFYMEAHKALIPLIKDLDYSPYEGISKSERFEGFLKANRPPILFFDPAEIASLLTPDSDIVVTHKETDQFKKWQFTLNPQKYEVSNDLFSPHRKQTITLTRGDVGEYSRAEPYLIVGFPARYDDLRVVFYPDIKITWGDSSPRDKLETALFNLLGLVEHKVEQQLVFKPRKEEHQMPRTEYGKTRIERYVTCRVDIDLAEPEQESVPLQPKNLLDRGPFSSLGRLLRRP